MIPFLTFIFGASLGSFAHVVADRLRVKSIVNGRSACLSCNSQLKWYELIPVVSYVSQKGKCRNCKTKIPPTLLLSEVITGILVAMLPFVVTNMTTDLWLQIGIFFLLATAICISISVIIYDIRHGIVPLSLLNALCIIGIILTIIRQLIYGFNIYDTLGGFIIALPYCVLYAMSRGRWVGLGDVIMYFAYGMIIGLPFASTGFFYSIWIGAIVAIMLMITFKNEYGMKSELPFTPFIIIGMLLALYTYSDILTLSNIIYN